MPAQLWKHAPRAVVGAEAMQSLSQAMQCGARCRPETWEDVAPSDSEEQRAEALEQLSAHLVHVLHTANTSVCMLAASSKP